MLPPERGQPPSMAFGSWPCSTFRPSPDCHAALRFIAKQYGIVPTLKRMMLSGAPTPVRTMTVATG